MKNTTNLPPDVVDVSTAIERTEAWRNYLQQHNDLVDIKAFNIPKDDLKGLLNEDGVESVRAYLGIIAENKIDLLFVGVDQKGQDMIDYNSTQKHYIYDLTTPCPAMCDENSPLNKG